MMTSVSKSVSQSSRNILRWGICGTGLISTEFTTALLSLKEHHKVEFVGCSNAERGKKFADQFKIPTSGSYKELAACSTVDIVYIGCINAQHVPLSQMMLNHGKHVLCEKPLTSNLQQTQQLTQLAVSKNLFLQEGFWTRMFPLVDKLEEILTKKTKTSIGEAKILSGTFAKNSALKPRREHFFDLENENGVLLSYGSYLIWWALFVFKDYPTEVTCRAIKKEDGADLATAVTLRFPNDRIANLLCCAYANFQDSVDIGFTRGYIRITPTWCPTKMDINGEVEEFDLPPNTSGFNHKGTNCPGFQYEIEAVKKCVDNGLLENALVPHETSRQIAQIMDECRRQIGIVYPSEKK